MDRDLINDIRFLSNFYPLGYEPLKSKYTKKQFSAEVDDYISVFFMKNHFTGLYVSDLYLSFQGQICQKPCFRS